MKFCKPQTEDSSRGYAYHANVEFTPSMTLETGAVTIYVQYDERVGGRMQRMAQHIELSPEDMQRLDKLRGAIVIGEKHVGNSFFNQLSKAMQSCIDNTRAIERKRWSASEKAMALASQQMRYDVFKTLRERIGNLFNIGGF